MLRAFDQGTSQTPHFAGFLDTTNWEDTQNPLEGLYISFGLRRPQYPQEELESIAREKDIWNTLCMDGWMDGRKLTSIPSIANEQPVHACHASHQLSVYMIMVMVVLH